MNSVNPFIIPRNHLVEESIQGAIKGDYSLFENLVDALKSPYKEDSSKLHLTTPPTPEQVVKETFCGT